MKDLIKRLIREMIEDDEPIPQSNLNRLLSQFKTTFPYELKSKEAHLVECEGEII